MKWIRCASQQSRSVNVRFGSKADILTQRITDPKTEIAAEYSKRHHRALAPLAVIGWRKSIKRGEFAQDHFASLSCLATRIVKEMLHLLRLGNSRFAQF
jgi:hypothetical protein